MAIARASVPALILSLLLVSSAGLAQTAPAATATARAEATTAQTAAAAPTPAAGGAAPAAGGAAPSAGGDPPAASADPAKPKVEATGYGYADPKPRRTGGVAPRAHRAARASGPIATLPGFEMTGDGGSRLFVELTQSVPVEEKKAAGTLTYVLRGAHVQKHNNQNALVTVHFNTPVSRARLVPHGNDLHFIVEMRSTVTPAWKLEPAKDNSAVLTIDFPKGDFLPNGPAPAPTQLDPSDPNGQPPGDTTTTDAPRKTSSRKKKP